MISSILQRPSVCAHSQLAVQQIVIFCIIGFQSSKQSSEICAIVHNWVLYLWAIVREMQTSLMEFCSSECSELLIWTMIVMMTSISHEGQCVHIPNLSCNIAPFLPQCLPPGDVDVFGNFSTKIPFESLNRERRGSNSLRYSHGMIHFHWDIAVYVASSGTWTNERSNVWTPLSSLWSGA